jgi:hypothetical protein
MPRISDSSAPYLITFHNFADISRPRTKIVRHHEPSGFCGLDSRRNLRCHHFGKSVINALAAAILDSTFSRFKKSFSVSGSAASLASAFGVDRFGDLDYLWTQLNPHLSKTHFIV